MRNPSSYSHVHLDSFAFNKTVQVRSCLTTRVAVCRCLDRGFRHVDEDGSVKKLKEIDDIMLATGLYERIAILPGGTNMTADVERAGLDVFYRRTK